MTKPKILISYARADGLDTSARLRSELQRTGYEVWRDIEEMRGGQDWREQIRAALRECHVMLILLSPASVSSKQVDWEFETAQTLETPVLFALIAPCVSPSAWATLHYQDLSNATAYSLGLAALIRDINELASKNTPQPNAKSNTNGVQFDFTGANISQSQIGNGNVMVNRGGREANNAVLLAQISQIIAEQLESKHIQLKAQLLTEISKLNTEQMTEISAVLASYQNQAIRYDETQALLDQIHNLTTLIRDESVSVQMDLQAVNSQISQIFDAELTHDQQFQLSVPIIPGILSYNATYGGNMSINLRNAFDALKNRWSQMLRRK